MINTRCPKKLEWKALTDYMTKGFRFIVEFSSAFNIKHSNFDTETKSVQIRYKLTEIRQFQNRQFEFDFLNFASLGGINFHKACALNNMPL